MPRIAAVLAVLLAAAAVPAHALNWSIGPNLGVSFIDPKAGDNLTVFSWPLNNLLFGPGIRVGFAGENPAHEFYLDTGLLVASSSGSSQSYYQFVGNYQYNFPTSGSNGIFLTGGVGVNGRGFSNGTSQSATSLQFGGGVGVRHKMGNGHGVMRAEVRADQLAEGEDSGSILIPELTVITIKLGVDLWDK